MSALITQMRGVLASLETKLDAAIADNPAAGHGGTPHITDNTKGRRMMRVMDKRADRIHALFKKIEEQKEKIERAEGRAATLHIQTKASKAFIQKNPIHPGLEALADSGEVRPWPRNPQYFFVDGLHKVALATFDGKVRACKRFPPKNKDEWKTVNALIARTKGEQA